MKTYKQHRIEVRQDQDPLDPRKYQDNSTIMSCQHRRYSLGDNQDHIFTTLKEEIGSRIKFSSADILKCLKIFRKKDPKLFRYLFRISYSKKVNSNSMHIRAKQMLEDLLYNFNDTRDIELIEDILDQISAMQWNRLYLYDHSGLRINLKKTCSFDSGILGYVVIPYDDFINIENAYKIINEEIKEYNNYLSGDQYYYVVIEETCKIFDDESFKVSEEIVSSASGYEDEESARNDANLELKAIQCNRLKQEKGDLTNV